MGLLLHVSFNFRKRETECVSLEKETNHEMMCI